MSAEETKDGGQSAKAKPSLAVVSTFDELCGIAGYTRALVRQLEPHFALEVFDLDQFFMRSTNSGVRKKADAMIEEFCRRLKTFDSVNIQLEHGTLGAKRSDIIKRFNMIADGQIGKAGDFGRQSRYLFDRPHGRGRQSRLPRRGVFLSKSEHRGSPFGPHRRRRSSLSRRFPGPSISAGDAHPAPPANAAKDSRTCAPQVLATKPGGAVGEPPSAKLSTARIQPAPSTPSI